MLRRLQKKIFGTKKNLEKRQRYRYRLPPELGGRLTVQIPAGKAVTLPVIDINDEAVAASVDGTDIELPVLEFDYFPSELVVGTLRFPFQGESIRYGSGRVTLRFANYEEEDYQRLLAIFPVIIGKQLSEKPAAGPNLQWIHGPNYTDLFVRRDESQIQSLTGVSEDYYFSWGAVGGLKTGRVIRETYTEGLNFAKREQNPIVEDPFPDPLTQRRFVVLIQSSFISGPLKKEIMDVISS